MKVLAIIHKSALRNSAPGSATAGTLQSGFRGAQPPRLQFGAPRAERLWQQQALNGKTFSPATVSREGASHCARGGRAPHFQQNRSGAVRLPHRAQRGSVLVIVLLVAFGLISLSLYFANSMTMELRAADNRASNTAADQALEGATRYVGYLLTVLATNGAMPDPGLYQAEAVPVGNSSQPEQNARFWIIGRDPADYNGARTDPYYGLVDETSKLNLNRVDSNTLLCLPNMTMDLANAIQDWRTTNGTMSLNYAQMGYTPKHAPFESVGELRLVYGATLSLLLGDDVNRNGIIDGSESAATGTPVPGLMEYFTVYAREPNFHSDGTSLTNGTDETSLRGLLDAYLGSSREAQIMTSLGYTGNGANGNGGRGGGGGGNGFGGGGNGPGGGGNNGGATNMIQFYIRSGMNATEMAQIANNLTFSSGTYIRGRVNVNTASEIVLAALFGGIGIDQSTAVSAAQQLVTYRQQNPTSLGSIAWVVDALGSTSQVVLALQRGDYITTHSYQFTADIVAVGPYGRGYRRVKFVFDISDGTPKIVYRQDLSRLGWALGKKARENWVTQHT